MRDRASVSVSVVGSKRGFVAVGEVAPPVHGATVSFERVLAVLGGRSLLVQVVPMPSAESLSSPGRVSFAKLRRGLRVLTQAARALLSNPGAALYVNSLSPTRLGFLRDATVIFTASSLGRQVVCHVHSAPAIASSYERAGRLTRWLMRLVGRRIDSVWVLTPGLGTMIERFVPGDRIEVLSNASPDLGPSGLAQDRDADGPLRLLYLSNLIPEKGYPTLLQAAELLGSRGVEVEIRLVGAVPGDQVASDLEARIARLPNSSRCSVSGPVDPEQRGEQLAWADAFVLPTDYRWEAQPLSIIEAMSASLPIISTDLPGIAESVEHGVEGFLVEPRNAEAIADAIAKLTDDDERRRLAAAARARYEREYRLETFEERLNDLAIGVLDSPSRESVDDPARTGLPPFVVMGPIPPPIDGVSVSTQRVIQILAENGGLAATIDTTNPRSLGLMGGTSGFGLRDVGRGVGQLVSLSRALLRNPGSGLYMPLAPTRGGLLRDSLLILTAAALRRRIVVHLHSSEGSRNSVASFRGPAKWLVAAALRRVDQAWALTRGLGARLTPPFRPDQLRVLANFGDDLDGRPVEPDRGRGRERPLRLLYFSNLIPTKGYPDLLEALGRLGDVGHGLEVRLAGAAPEAGVEAEIERSIASLPPSVRVELRGSVSLEQRQEEYAWADAFVLPTSYPMESQPLTILEALSAGLPVISTMHAGIPETVTHGVEALLIAPGDTEALADAIRRLAADPALVADMSAAARRRYEGEFTPERYADRVRNLLESA